MSKRPSATYNDPGYFYDQKKLFRIFAIASGLLMIGIIGIIWVDFDRPWKDIQRAQMKWEAGKLALEKLVLETRTRDVRGEIERDRTAAEAEVESAQAEIARLETKLRDARGAYYLADMTYKEQKQYTLEAEYHVHEAADSEDLQHWVERMKQERDREFRLRDVTRMANDELNRLLAQRKRAEQALDDIVARERANAELKRMEILEQGIEKKKSYNPAREIPLLDFLAAPTKVEQVVLENLVDNYEFAMPNKVDRCATCHVGSTRLGFEKSKWPIGAADPEAKDPARFEQGLYNFLYDVIDGVVEKAKAGPFQRENELNRKVRIHHQVLDLMWAQYDPLTGQIGTVKEGDTVRKVKKRWARDQTGEWRRTSKGGKWIGDFYLALLKRMEPHWRTHPHFDDMVGDGSPHPYEKFGCTTCHLGRGWSTDFGYAWHSPDRVQVDDWMTEERAEAQGKHLPLNAEMGLQEAMRTGIGSVAMDPAALEQRASSLTTGWVEDEDQAQRWKEERGRSKNKLKYWTWPQHPKLLVESSCLKCHKEGLYETPRTEYADVRIGKPDPATPGTDAWRDHSLAANEQFAADAFNRMFVPRKEEPYRPEKLERGMDNFLRFGCYGCHKLDPEVYPFMETVRPKIGPPLDEIAAKTTREWAGKWVANPKDFRPGTRMPRFWGLSNNSHDFPYLFADRGLDMVDGKAWGRAEVHAIVAWMWEESRARARTFPPVDLSKGDWKRGERIVVGYDRLENEPDGAALHAKACIACHDVPTETADLAYDRDALASWKDPVTGRPYGWKERMSRRQGPDLTGIGSKVRAEWLHAWLRDPRGYWQHTNMPDLRLTEQEALDVTAYLMRSKHEAFDALPPLGADQGIILEMAKELKVAEQQERTEEAISRVERWSEKERTLYVGRKLFKHYGCFGCHSIDEYKDATPIGTELTDWGSKILERLEFNHVPIEHRHYDFAYTKMRNPRIYDYGMPRRDKPYERLKMPRFGFAPEEARDLATFLIGLVNDPIPDKSLFDPDPRQRDIIRGRQIVWRYNCQGCHVIEDEGGDVWPAIAKEKWRPPNLLGQGIKTQPEWLFRFMKDPAFVTVPGVPDTDRVRPWHSIRMPTFGLTDEEARAVVRYFAALSEATADFESQASDSLTGKDAAYAKAKVLHLTDPDDRQKKVLANARNRLEEARAAFREYQCKSCHSDEAAIESAAPNFRHTRAGRLREAWIELWLWGPSKLQPGTAMPTFFEKSGKPFAEHAQFFEGVPDEQVKALRDYIRFHYTEEDR